jgi:hypothetical protein
MQDICTLSIAKIRECEDHLKIREVRDIALKFVALECSRIAFRTTPTANQDAATRTKGRETITPYRWIGSCI